MKNEQEKLEDFLKSELMKEGDEILAEIEADESLKDISLPEEMDEGLWKKIQKRQAEKAAYEALSEKDKEALRLGRELLMMNECGEDDGESGVENDSAKIVKYSRKRKKRIYFLVAAVAVLALAAGMTSIGGAPFVTGMMKKIIGDREMVQIDSEREGNEDRVTTENEEEKIWQSIKETLKVEPVRWGYIPEGTKIIKYDINEEIEEAEIIGEYRGEIIEYQLWVNLNNKSMGYDIEDKLLNEEEVIISGVEINIKHYETLDDKNDEYVAQFVYNNVYYTLNGRLPQDEFMQMINNLIFI